MEMKKFIEVYKVGTREFSDVSDRVFAERDEIKKRIKEAVSRARIPQEDKDAMFNYLVKNQSSVKHGGGYWWQLFRAPTVEQAWSTDTGVGKYHLATARLAEKYTGKFKEDRWLKHIDDDTWEKIKKERESDPGKYERFADKCAKEEAKRLKSNFKFDVRKAADAIEDHYKHMRKSTLDRYRK